MRRLFTTLFCFVLALCAMGDNISEEQALDIAARFFNSTSNASNAKGEATPLTIAKISTGYYAVNRGDSDGYVIVAATDRLGSDVLGYADEGTIDTLSMPDNMRWWLAEYDRQATYAESHGTTVTTRTASRTAIEPLLTCLWDQESPYCDQCPTYNGQTCAVGCVATAMAQIMYYHKWPKQGMGSVSYDWNVNNRKYKTLTADFSQSTYDWDAMSDTYNSSSTTEAKNAVAKLMADVGMACQMQYSPSGSGAYSYYAATAMADHFSYDKGLQYVQRDFYTHDEWEEMIYGELAASRPLFYAGSDNSGTYGHAFVFDGYKDGYYHVNWGWSGTGNGYFLITSLTPDQQGTGGSGTNYSYDAEAIIGLCPAVDGSAERPVICNYSCISTSTISATRSTNVWFNVALMSTSLSARNLTFGLKVVKNDSGATTYVSGRLTGTLSPYIAQSSNFVTGYQVSMNGFPTASGTYRVYPACYDNALGQWIDVHTNNSLSTQTYLTAIVSGNSIRFSTSSALTVATLTATEVAVNSKLYARQSFTGTATFTAAGGDYYGNVKIGFAASSTSTSFTTYGDNATLIDLADGTSQQQTFTSTAPSTAGTYYMAVVDDDGNQISNRVAVTVNSVPTTALAFTAESISMPSTSGVDPLNINISFKVKCTGGLFNGCFYAYFFEKDTKSSSTYLASDNIVMAEGDEATITISGAQPQLSYDTTYTAFIIYNGNFIEPYSQSGITFTTAASAGIDAASTDREPKDIAIYNLNGVLMSRQKTSRPDLSSLPNGVYIVKMDGKTKKVVND